MSQQNMKLTPKQEGFCMSYIETGNASEAYRLHYNAEKMKPDSVNRLAHELLHNIKITSRIKELRSLVTEKYICTAESLAKELDEDRELARDLGQPGAAVAAVNAKARLFGLDKQVISNDPDNPMPANIHVEIIRK